MYRYVLLRAYIFDFLSKSPILVDQGPAFYSVDPMSARNKLLNTPPYAVEQTLRRLGTNLRTARLRRNLTIEDMAQKIGTGPRAITDAEKGKPSASVAIYAALLWALDLLNQLDEVATPQKDEHGQVLALARERSRARPQTAANNDF